MFIFLHSNSSVLTTFLIILFLLKQAHTIFLLRNNICYLFQTLFPNSRSVESIVTVPETKCFSRRKFNRISIKTNPSKSYIITLEKESLMGIARLVTLILINNINIKSPGVFSNYSETFAFGENILMTTINGSMSVGLSSLEMLRISGNRMLDIAFRSFSNIMFYTRYFFGMS